VTVGVSVGDGELAGGVFVTGGAAVVRVDRGVGRRVGVDRRTDGDGLAGVGGLDAAVGLGDGDRLDEADGEEDTDGCAEPGEPYASSTPIPPATAKYTPSTAAARTTVRPVATVARRRRSSASYASYSG
jgi:hypothetical protein